MIMHDQHDASRDPLQNQLANLDQLFQEFAGQYESAARSLRDGYVPDPIPNIQLDAARKVLDDTLAAIYDAAAPFDLEPMPENPSLGNATEFFNQVLEARAEAERQRRLLEEARIVVSEVEALQHMTAPDELHRVREAIEALTAQLEDRDLEKAEQLVGGSHPLAMLVAYASHRDTLSDEEYDAFRDTIEQDFGRPVLRDIDRGRIVYNGENVKTPAEEVTDELKDNDSETPGEPVVDTDETVDLTESQLDAGPLLEIIDSSDDEFFEEVIEEEIPEEEAITESALFSDLDDGEDTLWPPLEGDGFGAVEDDAPEASLHDSKEDEDDKE